MRPDISPEADWIWTPDENDHDHVFCRFVQSNSEVNCPAAQARYWSDYPDVRARQFPAWQHFQDEGKALGFMWHSDLCNSCTGMDEGANKAYDSDYDCNPICYWRTSTERIRLEHVLLQNVYRTNMCRMEVWSRMEPYGAV